MSDYFRFSFQKTTWRALALVWALTARTNAGPLDHWTTNQVSTNYFGLTEVAYGAGRYVASGSYSDYGVLLSSEDGLQWTLRSDGNGTPPSGLGYVTALRYVGTRFFAFGAMGGSATSTNGIDWAPTFPGLNQGHGFAFGNGLYVAVGDPTSGSAANIYTSPDGFNWTGRTASGSPVNAGLIDVAYGAGRFVALGYDNGAVNNAGQFYFSLNGTTWNRITLQVGSSVSFNNGLFIAPFSAGVNKVSVNGSTWISLNTGVNSLMGKVSFANGLFMAQAGTHLVTSTNGTNWVEYAETLPGYGYSFATDGSRLVRVGWSYSGGQPSIYFDGFIYYSDVLVGLKVQNPTTPRLELSGLVGRAYRIDYTDNLNPSGTNDWQTLSNINLPSTPYLIGDPAVTNQAKRFYRGVLLP